GSEGIHTWDEDEIAQFERVHPIGSRERLAFTLGLYTAQRRGDVIRMGRQHIRQDPQDPNGEVLYVRQQKTGKELLIPIDPELRAVLDLIPATQMTFLMTLRGNPFHGGSFTQWFKKAGGKAGLPAACTFHGLRRAAACRDASAGCTVHEIAAHTGHASLKEVERYTKRSEQLRLLRAAMARTAAAREQSRTETVKPDRVRVSNPLSPLRKKPA